MKSVVVTRSTQLAAALAAGPLLCYALVHAIPGIASDTVVALTPRLLFWWLLFAPLVEETVFRGVIQEFLLLRMRRRGPWPGISWANLLTSVLFVSLHWMTHPPLWALSVFVPSMVYGYFKERFDRLWPPILLHAVYNASYLMLCRVGG